jgi:hypothetical protein
VHREHLEGAELAEVHAELSAQENDRSIPRPAMLALFLRRTG